MSTSKAQDRADQHFQEFAMKMSDKAFQDNELDRIRMIYRLICSKPSNTVEIPEFTPFADYVTNKMLNEEEDSVRQQFITEAKPEIERAWPQPMQGTAFANCAAVCGAWPDPIEGEELWKAFREKAQIDPRTAALHLKNAD